MKILLILSFATLAYSAKLYTNSSRTLADDFKDIRALVPQRDLADLILKYLSKDAEFQRTIFYFYLLSPEVCKAGELIESQPEIRDFILWLKNQLGDDSCNSLSDESNLKEFGNLLRYKSDKKKSLDGWKGFMKELLTIYPRKEIKNLIRDKVAANGVFAEFWSKMTSLRPVYERILKFDEVLVVIGKLNKFGVDTKQLDQLIREDFGWGDEGGAVEKEETSTKPNGPNLSSPTIIPVA